MECNGLSSSLNVFGYPNYTRNVHCAPPVVSQKHEYKGEYTWPKHPAWFALQWGLMGSCFTDTVTNTLAVTCSLPALPAPLLCLLLHASTCFCMLLPALPAHGASACSALPASAAGLAIMNLLAAMGVLALWIPPCTRVSVGLQGERAEQSTCN